MEKLTPEMIEILVKLQDLSNTMQEIADLVQNKITELEMIIEK
jgi:hypothetical protein